MTITTQSKASVVGVAVQNVQFQPAVNVVERKGVIIGTYDPALLDVVDEVPAMIFSANDAGVKYGFGFMIHRLAEQFFAGSRGAVRAWVVPQSEVAGGPAIGSIDFAGSTGVVAGTLNFYIASLAAPVSLIDGETPQNIALKLIAAINDDKTLPITAAIDGGIDTKVNFTVKSIGPWGDDISLALNLRPGETTPAGVAFAIVDLSGGTGIPDVQDALDGMGVGDNQNSEFFTGLICGYGNDTTTLDKISVYNGVGNEKAGNYREETSRFFRALIGDTDPGTAALTALIAAADLRAELDRTNGILGVPDNYHHPMELAANAMGIMERLANIRPEENFVNQIMPGIIPGPGTDRWTDNYTENGGRDLAVRSGISTTQFKNNTITLQDIVTFYRPDAVNPDSNGYRSQRNIAILQNLADNMRSEFEREFWQGITITEDVTRVTDLVSAQKARDTNDVIDALLALTELFEGQAWIFSKNFTIDRLKEGGVVNLRVDGRGWDINYPVILSGEGGIFNTTIQFDVSLAVFIS